MKFTKFAALALACACALSFVSCDKETAESSSTSAVVDENSIGEVITPDEDAEDYDLGNYRVSGRGTKLYFGDDTIPDELMLALENYFLTLQNNDFEGYKATLYPDYAERYEKYLKENYSGTMEGSDEYTLKNSFEMQCANLKNMLIDSLTYESETEQEFTGEYKLTRLRGERPVLQEGETEEKRIESYFEYLNEILGVDYYDIVSSDTEKIECLTFFVIVEAEDGQEHKIVNAMDIVFAFKDGKYYSFG